MLAVLLVLTAGIAVSTSLAVVANARLRRFDLLKSVALLREAERGADSLDAAWPDTYHQARRWRDQYWAPVEAALTQVLASRPQLATDASSGGAFLRRTLNQWVLDVEAFRQERLPALLENAHWSAHLADASDRHADRWLDAAASVGSIEGGADSNSLAPQVGLAPMGKNPATGLWEFYHLRSAADPTTLPGVAPDGTITRDESTGIIFVLVPGGTTWIGSQSDDPARPNYQTYRGQTREQPVHAVNLAPFFVAKHETTRGQWARLTHGSRPSVPAPEGQPIDDSHPVEGVSWSDCARVAAAHGLDLPTEAQWEYVCRATTSGTLLHWPTNRIPCTAMPMSATDPLQHLASTTPTRSTTGSVGTHQ